MDRLFDDDDPRTVYGIIRTFFAERGGNMPARVLAKAIVDEQVLPPGVVERAALRGVEQMCRRALSRPTAEGVPFAQPIGKGHKAHWQQLDLFTHTQARALIARRVQNLAEDYEVTRRLWTWCLERFGSAPEIPELIMPASVDEDPDSDDVRAEYDAAIERDDRD
jgi:hypothetical protein